MGRVGHRGRAGCHQDFDEGNAMKPSPRDLMVARAVRQAEASQWPLGHFAPKLTDEHMEFVVATALLESLPEPAEHEHTPSSEAPHHPACTRSFDARDWARDFNATAKSLGYCDMDEGWLIGWFANAIMRGFDEAERRRDAEHEQAAQDAVIDCGDNSCIFKPSGAGGMRTNGGCRCYERAGFGASAVGAARKMLPEVLRLRREVSVARREERELVTAIFLDEMQKVHEEQAAHPHARCINLLEEQHIIIEKVQAEVAAARAEGARAERERLRDIAHDVLCDHGLQPREAFRLATEIRDRGAQDEPS